MRTSPLGWTALASHASSEALGQGRRQLLAGAAQALLELPGRAGAAGFDLGIASRPPAWVDLAHLAPGRRLQGAPGAVGVGGQVGHAPWSGPSRAGGLAPSAATSSKLPALASSLSVACAIRST